jgi:hypothetical protein
MQHKVIIRRHVHPWVRVAIIATAVSLAAIGAWAFYAYLRATTVSGFERAQLEVESLQTERRELNRSLRQANAENERLRDELTYLQRSHEIDGQTCENVKASLDVLQAEVLDLREQVAFYRGIVSPEMARAGVRVYGLKVQAAEGIQNYRFEVVLIQSMRHERQVDGELRVTIEGGSARQCRWFDLGTESAIFVPLLSGVQRRLLAARRVFPAEDTGAVVP